MTNNLIEIKDVTYNIDEKNILENIGFQIIEGQVVTLIGPNGSGKTTLAKILLNLIQPSKGKIIYNKQLKFGYMPQHIHLNKNLPLTVKDFLLINSLGQKYIDELSEQLRISHISNQYLYQLSGGELQRVMLARSLARDPDFLVLDEAASALDINGQIEFYKLIDQLRHNHKITILMISHDLYMVMKSSDKIICINHHICCKGSVHEILNHESYINLFGQEEASRFLSFYKHDHDHKH